MTAIGLAVSQTCLLFPLLLDGKLAAGVDSSIRMIRQPMLSRVSSHLMTPTSNVGSPSPFNVKGKAPEASVAQPPGTNPRDNAVGVKRTNSD